MTKTFNAYSLTLGGLFVALTAIGANLTSIAPFLVIGGVPITLQTFFAVLAGLVLGRKLGAFSMFAYMMLGLAGAPIFAQFKGGAAAVISPTFGFVLSFILVAYIAGAIAERAKGIPLFITASLAGMAVNYIVGTNWMYLAYLNWFEGPAGVTYKMLWTWMAVPLPKDIALSVLAGVFAYRLQKYGLFNRNRLALNKKNIA